MPETDITKMKVADLKRELKIRGLATTGNKNELQDRLQNALLDGDDVLEDSCNISGEDDLLGDADLTDDEEAKILGEDENDDILSTHSLKSTAAANSNKSNASPLKLNTANTNAHSSEDELLKSPNSEANSMAVHPKKIILKRKNSGSNIAAPNNNTAVTSPAGGEAKENNIAEHSSAKMIKIGDNTSGAVVGESKENAAAVSKNKLSHMTQEERLELRRKKFGGSVAAAAGKDTNSRNAKIVNDISNDPDQLEKLKKRAERFGCAVAPAIADLESKDRLEKRKQRFGITSDSSATQASAVSSTNPSTDVWAEKARLRLERFNKGAGSDSAVASDLAMAIEK